MRQPKIALILAIAVMGSFVSCRQSPVEIYISVKGNDTASGTRDQPLLTFEKANEQVASLSGKREVHVIFEDGIYYLPNKVVLKPEHSGSEKYPVIYRAANKGKAIISGGDKLNLKWEPYKKGIYKALVSKDVIIDQLYINGDRQRMARFPNAVEGKNVFDTWDLVHTRKPDPGNDPLDEKRVSSWSHPEGAYVHAMHNNLWGDMHWLVKGKNADGSLKLEGGWQNNRPSPMHPRYRMVENVFEELDAPGEWFYNKDTKTLYYYPQPDVDLSSANVEIVRLKHLIEFRGTKEQPVSFIRLEGLVFRHAARTFMENKEPLLRSDWTIYRGGGVLFDGAEDCTVSDCEFDQLGGNSIFVNNYNRRISINSCYIHHSGATGIAFVGDPEMVRSPLFRYGKQDFERMDRTPGPKGDKYPSDCMVEDCLITMTGRDEKQTSAVQISMSHKITVRHASIYDVPRAGINISEGTFGGHVIEYCDVFNTVLETGDHGSFNSWGRDRFWTPDINETAKEVEKQPDLPKLDMLAPNTIRNSRWRCDHGWDIDLDDGSTWYFIYNNVLLNGGLKMREGYFRKATNNIILNNSLHPHVWYPNSGDIFKHNIVFGAYKPAVMKRGIAPDGQWGAQLDSNLFATNHEDRLKFSRNGCDAHSLVGNPMFVDAETGDFRVQDQSPALQIGFQNFPMDEFGVVSEKLREIAKQPEIPNPELNDTGGSGKVYQWFGASVKNVETLGEQSAAGLASISGVVLLSVPEKSELMKYGFQTGDVIVQVDGADIKSFAHLQHAIQANQGKKELEIGIMRNQREQMLIWKKNCISCSQKAGQWTIDSNEEWQKAEKEQTGFSYDNGFAVPKSGTAIYKSVIHSFKSKQAAKSIVFKQDTKWLNWQPAGDVGPVNLGDAPVFLSLGPNNYWMFGRYTDNQNKRADFDAADATLEGFDVPLQTTPFPNQYDAPGGLEKGLGGYHAWQSRDMVNWVHHGPVTEGFSKWVTTAEYVDGKAYIYYDYPNDQDPHLYIDDDLTDGKPGKNMGMAFEDPSHGSDCAFIRDLEGNFHVIIENWDPINARKHSWDSPLASHAVSPNGIDSFKILAPAVDERTTPTGEVGEFIHPHWSKEHPDWDSDTAKYDIHEPEQDAYGDWAAISIGGQYYLFCDYHPAGERIKVGWFTSSSLDKQFEFSGEIGSGHPDPDIGFAEGMFYLLTQTETDYVSPGPWVEKVEARVGTDTNNDGEIDTWTNWQEVKEKYDYIKGFAKQIKRTPASMDLSDLDAGYGFSFEVRVSNTTGNQAMPVLDNISLFFE